MGERELPEGWVWVRLEDITSKIETSNPENYPDKEFFYLDIDSVDNSQQKITNPKKILGSEAPSRARQIVKSGDVLFSTVRTYLKNIAIVEEQYDNQIASTGFCVIRPKNEVDNKFIFNYVQTQDFLKRLELLQRGANYPAVRESDVLSQQIPLPPLPIQRQIVAVLEQAEAVKQHRQEADALTGALLQSIFMKMFDDPVRNPKGWDTKKLGDLCTIRRGASPRPIDDYLGGTVPWIKIGDGTKGNDIFINSTSEKIIEAGVKRSVLLKKGSLIFANCGVSLGFARILNIEGCIHDGWLSLEDIDPSLNKIYLLKLINGISQHFRNIAPDGTQPNLNTGIMKNFLIPLPPLALQQQFARIVESVERIRQQQVASGKEIEGLCEGLMQRAFAGELVA